MKNLLERNQWTWCVAAQKGQQHEVIAKLPGDQVTIPNKLDTVPSHFLALIWMPETFAHPIGTPMYRVNEIARNPLQYLQRNASHRPPDDGFPFPECLRYYQPEPLSYRFLNDYCCRSLERIDLHMSIRWQFKDMNGVILSGCSSNFFNDVLTFRIITGPTSRENQTCFPVAPQYPKRIDYSDGVFESVESWYLYEHWIASRDVQFFTDLVHLHIREAFILVRKRINGRWYQDLGMTEPSRKRRKGENAGIVSFHEAKEASPDLSRRAREIYVTPPRPFTFSTRCQGQESSRLGIMNYDKVCSLEQLRTGLKILMVDFEIVLPRLIADISLLTLERVMEHFGRFEKLGITIHHQPVRVQTQAPLKRYETMEDLCYATTGSCRVHMNNGGTGIWLRETSELVPDPWRHVVQIVINV
jgi:hypothetical protein